jgi:hypothetical protein
LQRHYAGVATTAVDIPASREELGEPLESGLFALVRQRHSIDPAERLISGLAKGLESPD